MSGASPAPPGLAPMYGAPQTPTPVAVPQVCIEWSLVVISITLLRQEECIVTSSYEAAPPSRPAYDSGPPQQSAAQGPPPQQQHHAAPMPGPHQVIDWLLDLVIDTFLPTRCNNLSNNSSSNTTKATNSLSTTNRELSTTILLRRNIIKW